MTHPRRILIAVTGLSPQVITETLYALAVKRDPPWIPDEIQVMTTKKGAERIRLALLSDDPGGFHRLLQDYQLPAVRFGEAQVHVLRDAHGQPLEDIRTPEDNERAADAITDWVRRITQHPGTQIHASIAGGRKTMGYYLGYAMSLFGRPQDVLSHVLVAPPFESSWDFFYPTPYSRVIQLHDGQLVDTKDAEVMLAEIPFVRMRQGLDERMLQEGARFSELVQAANASLAPPELVVDPVHRCLRAAGKVIHLPPSQFAFYMLFVKRAKNGQPPLPAPPKEVNDPEWRDIFLQEYEPLFSELDDYERTVHALRDGMDGNYFSQLKSRLKSTLESRLGRAAAAPYLITSKGRPKQFYLDLPPEAIHFADLTRDPEGEQACRHGKRPTTRPTRPTEEPA